MRTATLLLVASLTIALVGLVPATALADGPCPSNCAPPEPCGWGPDVRKNAVGWASFYAQCAATYDPKLPLP